MLAGLSGGGAAAAYAGQATVDSGAALYTRQLLLAPYIDVASIGALLSPAIALGLGALKVADALLSESPRCVLSVSLRLVRYTCFQ